jgi:hypothetical protein
VIVIGNKTTDVIDLASLTESSDFERADLEFIGLDHSGPSFEARVFLNNEEASVNTTKDTEHGYAGTFWIFGHGRCYGDVGHCEIHDRPNPFDRRLPHQLTPANKTIIATEPIRRIASSGANEVTVTVVTLIEEPAHPEVPTGGDVLKYDDLVLVTYE